jgi:hypothetical protein
MPVGKLAKYDRGLATASPTNLKRHPERAQGVPHLLTKNVAGIIAQITKRPYL